MKEFIWHFLSSLKMLLGCRGHAINRKEIGNGNTVESRGKLKNVQIEIIGNCNHLCIRDNARLSNVLIYVSGDNHRLEIGEGCVIKAGSIWFEDMGCQIIIGKETTIESAHIAVTEPYKRIQIGDDCMFSTGIQIRTGDSHSIIDIVSNERVNYADDVIIDTHVWIGANATILKGVHIERNSVVASNSVGTKNVPANSVVAGVPARVIKSNVNWLRERIYGN
jgi:acetyltransferase-like isoleucine patch superfamily enzyme